MKSKFLKFILIPTLVVAVIATAACLWAAAGNEEGNEPAANSENSVVIGDVNGDGKVTLGDLVTLRKHILDANVAVDMIGADANEDGKVNSADILYLNRYFAGYDYDSEDPNYNPDVSDFATNHTDIVKLSNSLANGVNPYYTDASRKQVKIDNQNMSLTYGIDGVLDLGQDESTYMQVQSLTTPAGVPYVQNTMDIVLKMQNGYEFHASTSKDDAILNIYRYGYYYYETRIEGQSFVDAGDKGDTVSYNLKTYKHNGLSKYSLWGGPSYNSSTKVLSCTIYDATDPYIIFSSNSFDAANYDYLEFSLSVSEAKECSLRFYNGDTVNNPYSFTSVKTDDNDFYTYRIPISSIPTGNGNVTKIRFDINGAAGTTFKFAGVSVYKSVTNGAPQELSMQRTFHTYSDKLHHTVQLATTKTVTNVASVDMVTTIDANTVAKLVVKDKNGLKYTLDGVDWASAEYVGFDIKGAGIFGYILPIYDETVYENNRHGGVGSLNVTLSDGVYTITQSKVPEGNQLVSSAQYTRNANDFYMGQRIYTDLNHTFDEFLTEAEMERHPLTKENITVNEDHNNADFVGYDPIRGSYVFTLTGSSFQKSFHLYPNRQFRVIFSIEGDEYNRDMYFMTHMDDNGGLESAALLGEGDLLLPVPIEVCKNFGGDGENTIYNLDDAKYGETYFPMTVDAGETRTYTIVHAYQNWGIYPLKQISSIQYHTPFYHLSTGVTETNCIVPFAENGPTLPDHRAMSAPFWTSQPQHTSGGSHVFLYYTPAGGSTVVSNTTGAKIDSYGPTYSELELGFISSDGKIEASYTHIEFPQTDENRAFYTLSYKFKEDISFSDFKHDFKFYRCTDNDATGYYKSIGYLDVNDNHAVAEALVPSSESERNDYVLGKNAPYFTFYDMEDCSADSGTHVGYVNISFLIQGATLNGEELETNFIISNFTSGGNSYISLSLNETAMSFKAGDEIEINAIIMPWGSHLLDDGIEDVENGNYEYTSVVDGEVYNAKNVRDVREDSILNRFRAVAISDAEVLDSVWLPRIQTTNGKSAEFSVMGGNNNCAVRVYGFDQLTNPVIEEFVDGEWVPYETASATQRDDRGYGYHYDGYMVHYDDDRSYSYSFVIPMDNGAERRFRIVVDGLFDGWPTVDPDPEANNIKTEGDPLNVYVDASELVSFKDDTLPYLSDLELVSDEEDFEFARYWALEGVSEAIIEPFKLSHKAYKGLESTGQYAVIKYRIPVGPDQINNIQFFASTVRDSARNNQESFALHNVQQDGEWHVLVIDLQKSIELFYLDGEGKCAAKYFRIDIFNHAVSDGMYIDLAYVGLCDNLKEIYDLNSDMEEISFVSNSSTIYTIDPNIGQYRTNITKVLLDTNKISAITTTNSPAVFNAADTTLTGTSSLGVNGWFMVEGGVKEYKYNVIGTTTVTRSFGAGSSKSPSSDGGAYATIASGLGLTNAALSGVTFNGDKYFDLSGFGGQTVTVELIAVTNNGDEIVAAIFNNVKVP